MLKPRPLTTEFGLVWVLDPAIDRDRLSAPTEAKPDPDPDEFDTPEKFAEARSEASLERFNEHWRVALETLNFAPLIRPGEEPTTFHFRPLRGIAMEEFRRTCVSGGDGLFTPASCFLAFRACLLRVDNFPGLPLAPAIDPLHPALGPMVSPEAMAILDQVGVELGARYNHIAITLGSEVISRSIRPSPK